ncbi:MAG: AMP-binding protein [Steroidobacteraceae bacterium]
MPHRDAERATPFPRRGGPDASLPLIGHASELAALAYRQGRPITAGRFLGDVRRLAAALPPGRHVLNACNDRYHFAVGLGAALLGAKISLLPSTQTPEVIRWLREFAADAICLTDDPGCSIDLPRFHYPFEQRAPHGDWQVPRIPGGQLAAYVFTSGSTGAPVPHAKTWGKLMQCVAVGAQRLGLARTHPATLVGTVPPQHMYGFESTVLVALYSGTAFCAERPFYPADIAAAIAQVPRPRALVTTPVHLRALLQSGLPLPPADLLVCATAQLSESLARAAEEAFAAPLVEIYGSTETGQIASRRPVREVRWWLWPEVQLQAQGGRTYAFEGHIETRTAVNDVLELLDEEHFLLHGRATDLVNIAGKRSSFGYLNHQLNAIEGVQDGAFFLREDTPSETGVSRLGALVVAPELDAEGVLRALRERIDPVFLPRPLLFVARLPRNDTGKLPQEALTQLARALIAGQRPACTDEP